MMLPTVATMLYAPVLFAQRIFFDFDMFNEGYAYASYFSQHPRSWLSSAYTNAYHSGANLAYNLDNHLYGLLVAWKPTWMSDFAAVHVIMAGFLILFLVALYQFFREQSFSRLLSFTLTMTILASGRYLSTATSWLWVAMYFSFPALYVILRRWSKTHQQRWIWLGGSAGALSVLFGQTAGLIIVLIPLMCYVLFLLWQQHQHGDKKNLCKTVLGMAGMLALTLLLAGWYLIPTYHLAKDTPRAEGISYQDVQAETLHRGDAVRLFLPQWTLFTSSEGQLFVSIFVVIFALLSLARPVQTQEEKFWRWMLIGTIIFALPYSPLSWLANHLPLFKSVRAPSRMIFVSLLALAVLAGEGWRHWLTYKPVSKRQMIIQNILATILAMLGSLIILATIFDAAGDFSKLENYTMHWFDVSYFPRTRGGLPLEHYHNVLRSMLSSVQTSLSINSRLTLLTLLGVLVTWLTIRRRLQPTTTLMATAGLSLMFAVSQLWSSQTVKANVLNTIPKTAEWFVASSDSTVQATRLYTLFYGAAKFEFLDTPSLGRASPIDQITFARDMLSVNGHLRYGIQSIDGYDNFMTRRTSAMLNAVYSENMPTGDRLAATATTRQHKIHDMLQRLHILEMMNVGFILSAYQLNDSRLTPVWRGESTSLHIPLIIYKLAQPLPRFFLARKVQIVPEDEDATLALLLDKKHDPHTVTVLECNTPSDCQTEPAIADDKLTVVTYTAGNVHIKTQTKGTRLLVFNENYLRGWQVNLDGQSSTIHFTNGLFQGMIVPTGTHDIVFHYAKP